MGLLIVYHFSERRSRLMRDYLNFGFELFKVLFKFAFLALAFIGLIYLIWGLLK